MKGRRKEVRDPLIARYFFRPSKGAFYHSGFTYAKSRRKKKIETKFFFVNGMAEEVVKIVVNFQSDI